MFAQPAFPIRSCRVLSPLTRLPSRQASRYYNSRFGIVFLQFSYCLTAFGRCGLSNAACVDDDYIRIVVVFNQGKSVLLEQLPYLLAFVLIDFAAQCIYGKSFHNVL